MKKLLLLLTALIILIVPAYAVPGTIHLIFTNGEIVEESGNVYYDFDVEGYVDGGEEALGCGMVYVEYPVSIFGDLAINNNIVTVTKTGILEGVIPNIGINLYDIFENDTFTDVFALTFDSPVMGNSSARLFFAEISDNPGSPSEMLHIRMKVSNYGTGNVLFPSYIPGLDELYYTFFYETFEGGLDITEAIEPVVYEDPAGEVVYKSFKPSWIHSKLVLKWVTEYENKLVGYVIMRAEGMGGTFVELASYETNSSLLADNLSTGSTYNYTDFDANMVTPYQYYIEAIDEVGNVYPTGKASVFGNFIAYPNPFNPSFVVPFELMDAQEVNIKLYDLSGHVVKNVTSGMHQAGQYEYKVNCEDLSSGIYLLRSVVDGTPNVQKMMLVK